LYGLNITSCSLIPNFFAFKHPLLHIFLRTSDSFSSLKITLNVSKTRSTQRRPRTYYTILWFIRATIFVVERQQCVPFVLLKHIRRCQQSNKYLKRCHGSTTMRSPYCCASNNTKHAQVFMQNGRCFCPQQCVLRIVALPTTRNTLRYSCKMADVSVRFLTEF